ncbi:unnamed protein product [Rhizoctonia solani]|uniref:Uncharacterized protein n=1 Tax=Rhizoctonia solani TaxID=456999 RepID=A0A8H3E568_9AGAM|nr:unnamed protein product [Rhizoctonia solani]
MVNIRDGGVYRFETLDGLIASYDRGQFVPGAELAVRNYEQLGGEYESRFVAKSVPGDKWKFTLLHDPSVCLGFLGSPFDDPVLSTVRDDGAAHTEWSVDHGSGEHESLIHAEVDSDDVAWTVPDRGVSGLPILLTGQNGSPGQQWKVGIPIDD